MHWLLGLESWQALHRLTKVINLLYGYGNAVFHRLLGLQAINSRFLEHFLKAQRQHRAQSGFKSLICALVPLVAARKAMPL